MKKKISDNETASAYEDIKALSEQTGEAWLFTIYRLCCGLIFLAEQPETTDLRSDMYMMF